MTMARGHACGGILYRHRAAGLRGRIQSGLAYSQILAEWALAGGRKLRSITSPHLSTCCAVAYLSLCATLLATPGSAFLSLATMLSAPALVLLLGLLCASAVALCVDADASANLCPSIQATGELGEVYGAAPFSAREGHSVARISYYTSGGGGGGPIYVMQRTFVLMMGGLTGNPDNSGSYSVAGDVWTFGMDNETWVSHYPGHALAQSPRALAAVASDYYGNIYIVGGVTTPGGLDGTLSRDIFFSPSPGNEARVNEFQKLAIPPWYPRFLAALTQVPQSYKMLLVGGYDYGMRSSEISQEVWLYSGYGDPGVAGGTVVPSWSRLTAAPNWPSMSVSSGGQMPRAAPALFWKQSSSDPNAYTLFAVGPDQLVMNSTDMGKNWTVVEGAQLPYLPLGPAVTPEDVRVLTPVQVWREYESDDSPLIMVDSSERRVLRSDASWSMWSEVAIPRPFGFATAYGMRRYTSHPWHSQSAKVTLQIAGGYGGSNAWYFNRLRNNVTTIQTNFTPDCTAADGSSSSSTGMASSSSGSAPPLEPTYRSMTIGVFAANNSNCEVTSADPDPSNGLYVSILLDACQSMPAKAATSLPAAKGVRAVCSTAGEPTFTLYDDAQCSNLSRVLSGAACQSAAMGSDSDARVTLECSTSDSSTATTAPWPAAMLTIVAALLTLLIKLH